MPDPLRGAPPRLTLLAPLQRSASGSGAFLALASDGHEYWTKAPGNPQGSRTLIAEVVAYGLGQAIGAPVPRNALIEIPAGMDWSYAEARRLRPGIAHGSRSIQDAIVADTWDAYSGLDHNRQRQASILGLWDLCMGVDPQWLHQTTEDYGIWSFDHGFWLAGEVDWTLDGLRRIGTSPWQHDLDPTVASAGALRAAAERIERLDLATIRSIADHVPVEWDTTSQELAELASILFLRAEGVADRLRAAAATTPYA